MLRTLLISAALLAASGTALAHGDYGYGRVVTVEPHFAISFGTRHHDGFSVLYEYGGSRYWTYAPHHPGHVVALPPPHRTRHLHHHHHRHDGRGWDGRDDGWREHRRHRHH